MRSTWVWVVLTGCPGPAGPRACPAIEADLAAEQAAIQACTVDADCGQVLVGTSCGCTRDLVANVDADPATFQALVTEAGDGDCAVGLDSVCDCPQAAGFRCDAGRCAWNYVSDWPHLPKCSAALGDAYDLSAAALDGTDLVATVGYGGGCEAHVFTLCWPDQAFRESDPVQAGLELYHDAHGDPCDAYFVEDHRFSLVPLSDAYAESYGSSVGTIDVQVGGFGLRWTFGGAR